MGSELGQLSLYLSTAPCSLVLFHTRESAQLRGVWEVSLNSCGIRGFVHTSPRSSLSHCIRGSGLHTSVHSFIRRFFVSSILVLFFSVKSGQTGPPMLTRSSILWVQPYWIMPNRSSKRDIFTFPIIILLLEMGIDFFLKSLCYACIIRSANSMHEKV